LHSSTEGWVSSGSCSEQGWRSASRARRVLQTKKRARSVGLAARAPTSALRATSAPGFSTRPAPSGASRRPNVPRSHSVRRVSVFRVVVRASPAATMTESATPASYVAVSTESASLRAAPIPIAPRVPVSIMRITPSIYRATPMQASNADALTPAPRTRLACPRVRARAPQAQASQKCWPWVRQLRKQLLSTTQTSIGRTCWEL
jgi:hypothetical protein